MRSSSPTGGHGAPRNEDTLRAANSVSFTPDRVPSAALRVRVDREEIVRESDGKPLHAITATVDGEIVGAWIIDTSDLPPPGTPAEDEPVERGG